MKVFPRPLAALVFFCVFCFSGCLTGILPGENAKILRNLAGEYFSIAGAYANIGRYENALTYYQLAMRDKNYYTASFYESARMYAFLSRWAEAAKVYETLLKNDPKNKDMASSLAYVKAMSGDLAGAETLYNNLLQDHFYDEALHDNYIRVLAAQEKKKEALEAFETYKEFFPSDVGTAGTNRSKLEELLAPFMSEAGEASGETDSPQVENAANTNP
jgi:tetratricopeptide (TPR) repeat protein